MTLPFNMGAVVTSLFSDTVRVRRYTQSYSVEGIAQRPLSTSFTSKVSLQPIVGEDLQRLREAFNATELVNVWSAKRLVLEDEIVAGANTYVVQHLDDWNANGLYWRAVATLKAPGEIWSQSIDLPDSIDVTVSLGEPAVTSNYTVSAESLEVTVPLGTPSKVEIDWQSNLYARFEFDDSSAFGTDAKGNIAALTRVANGGGYPKSFTAKLGADAIEFDHSGTTAGSNASDNYLYGPVTPAAVVANFATSFTVCFWWNKKSVGGSENTGLCNIAALAGDGTGAGGAVEGDTAFAARYRVSTNEFSFIWTNRTGVATSTTKGATFTPVTPPATNTWVHVAMRYTNIDSTQGTAELFFDGVLVNTQGPSTTQAPNTMATWTPTAMKLYLGRSSFDSNPPLSPIPARIDRMSIYNAAISNAAIGYLAAQS